MSHDITVDAFLATDIRLSTLVQAHAFPEAHQPVCKLTIAPGSEIGIKHSSAQITTFLHNREPDWITGHLSC